LKNRSSAQQLYSCSMGVSPSKRNDKLLALHDAAAADSLRNVTKLLQQHADPAARAARDGHRLQTSLLLAVLRNDATMVCRMLTFVGNVDSLVSAWHTGLQLAALLGHPQLTRVLIAQGAAVDGAAAGTPLPLQLASDAETMLELLSGGAKMTALESHQRRRVICVLIKADAGALSVTEIEDILHTSEDAAGFLQQLQADSSLCSSYSNTALAVSKQAQLAVEYLRQDSIAVEALGHCSTLMCEHRDAALPAFEYTLFHSSSSSSAVVDVSREQQADAVAHVQQLRQLEREKRLRVKISLPTNNGSMQQS
jgi:hypothetical protein